MSRTRTFFTMMALTLFGVTGLLALRIPHHTTLPPEQGLIFPKGFIWGVATSAPQTVGSPHSDWAAFIAARGVTPNWPGLTDEDIENAGKLGVKELRFSVEWADIEPVDGTWDEAALMRCIHIAQICRRNHVRPFVNLAHFTLPLWVSMKGGLTWPDFPDRFARYADKIAGAMRAAGCVRFMTFNEPLVPIEMGYINGMWPPFKHADIEAAEEASWQIIRAHKAAYQAIHRHDGYYTKSQVGVAYFDHLYLPAEKASKKDRNTAAFLAWRDASIMDAIVDQCDYIGINYYQPSVVKFEAKLPEDDTIPIAASSVALVAPSTEHNMVVYPQGISKIVRRYARYHKPIIVTENGVADKEDKIRARFIIDHLAELHSAVSAQQTTDAPIIGYFYWCLADTWEWDSMRMSAFGLLDVDPATKKRSIRLSALLYHDIISDNGISWRALRAQYARDPRFK